MENLSSPLGANIYEARYAPGRKDFVSKLEIALKEASETGYWLELSYRTDYTDETTYTVLNDQCTTIRVMLVASCRTAKQNTVTWQSDNDAVVKIDPASGNLTATGTGTATVTATANDGRTASCTVTVKYTFWQWLIRIFLFGWIWY